MAETFTCRDETLIPAPADRCFAILTDLDTYARWWTLVRFRSVTGERRLAPGVRVRFEGARPSGPTVGWTAEVLEVDAPTRIELRYAEGDLLGRTAWELTPEGDATRVAYVYRAVRANAPQAAATFARYGTRLHSVAMHADALAGLARLVGGAGHELDDDAWRERVRRRVAEGVAALTA